jgi:hypothetical protein
LELAADRLEMRTRKRGTAQKAKKRSHVLFLSS